MLIGIPVELLSNHISLQMMKQGLQRKCIFRWHLTIAATECWTMIMKRKAWLICVSVCSSWHGLPCWQRSVWGFRTVTTQRWPPCVWRASAVPSGSPASSICRSDRHLYSLCRHILNLCSSLMHARMNMILILVRSPNTFQCHLTCTCRSAHLNLWLDWHL